MARHIGLFSVTVYDTVDESEFLVRGEVYLFHSFGGGKLNQHEWALLPYGESPGAWHRGWTKRKREDRESSKGKAKVSLTEML